MSQASLSGPPRAWHLGSQSCENAPGELGWGILGPRVARMSFANRAGPTPIPGLRRCLWRLLG
eukprot:1470292-Pyramimonas_sp.AAC.1